MDALGLIASIVSSLAWPLVAISIAFMFRAELTGLLARLSHFKVAGSEANFGEGLARAEDSVQAFKESSPDAVESGIAFPPPDAAEEAIADPSGMVLRAWEGLAESVFALRRATAGRGRPSTNLSIVLRQLVDEGVVNSFFLDSVEELRQLRNHVAHAREVPTKGSAIAYVEQARELQAAAELFARGRS
ncbi:hypothetical protein [Salinibacterium sp. ZJ77]|uniref:hypothetical protein n=1 Tax=Salinibacterium sp. ZJ77 TaxID=2708337 RepID=UPI0014207DF0|nr:hypothetical protein [Salinibacterium sp. ZJ77]